MVSRLVPAAVVAVVAVWGVANAQSAGDFGGPQELPHASFAGQQYVDSKGCVFLRAGFSGRTTWVPRVSRDRSQLCGYPPTFGKNQVVIAEPPRQAPAPVPVVRAAPSPAPEPKATNRRPMDTVASITTPPRIRAANVPQTVAPSTYVPPAAKTEPAPRVQVAVPAPQPVAPPQVQRQSAERVASTAGNGKIGCYSDAPHAERFRLREGGSIVLCTRGDGVLAHARAPRVDGGAAAVAPSGYLEVAGPAGTAVAQKMPRIAVSFQDTNPVPKGYKKAFTDDRLNPDRAKGTREGWAQQDRVWTRDVPAKLVEDTLKPKTKGVAVRKVYASSKSEAQPARRATPASGGQSYVQVGTFGQPSNAEGASSRLAQLGLPVARSKIQKNGKALQIVMAGPFASSADAQAALNAARRAGFGDAFIR